ncbi:MAG TPA: tetratricopeptide repeat protein [Longimicrobiaceae bacterium]|nr:tetratricopeptide repeat protein [Longimicrobiaceae bacterium]
MISRRSALLTTAVTIVALGGAGWAGMRLSGTPAEAAPVLPAALGGEMSDVEVTNRQIAFYEERVEGDPRAAADRAALAGLYLQRSRETGEFEDFRRAERLARESLGIRVKMNSRAARILTASLLAQHRFAEALEAAQELVRVWPEDPAHRALLAEIQMELGEYDAARRTLGSLESARENLAVAPRLARWAEVTGRPAEERQILYATADRALYRTDLPREQAAWYFLRVGEHELRFGRLDEAEKAFRDGLQVEPSDFRLVSALARVEAHRGNWRRAVAYGEAVGDAADIRTLGAIGDAYAQLGDRDAAERYYDRVEKAAADNPEPFNRQWTQFRLDHDRHVPETLAILQEEIRTRRDVLGYDMLAWALYRSGRYAEAREAMSGALRMGTQDATLHFHAGMIERALGNREAARRHLEHALELNPRFHPTFPAEARAALRSLR